MHVPDGFLEPGTVAATSVVAAGGVALALRRSAVRTDTRVVPLAGLTAAFVFAAQMVNFPVAGGTSGHLVGGTLAAVLLGPATAAVVLTVVVATQAILFADGGITALGVNIVNMALITTYGGYGVYVAARRVLPRTGSGVVSAAALAAGASTVFAATAFSIEWLFGASAPVAFDTVFGSMVGVHALIGIGEAAITGAVLSTVLATRPDLVAGAADVDRSQLAGPARVGVRGLVIGGLGVSLVVAAACSQFASTDPDGLERVAIDRGFAHTAASSPLSGMPFADYATAGIGNADLSLALAGVSGTLVVAALSVGMLAGRPSKMRALPRAGTVSSSAS